MMCALNFNSFFFLLVMICTTDFSTKHFFSNGRRLLVFRVTVLSLALIAFTYPSGVHSTVFVRIEGHRAAYYPPELQDECGSSDSSIDIYMFGVLMLQIAHGIPCVMSRKERRGLIQKLSERHILKSSITWCTELEKNKRPSANSVHESIKSLLEELKQKMELKNNS